MKIREHQKKWNKCPSLLLSPLLFSSLLSLSFLHHELGLHFPLIRMRPTRGRRRREREGRAHIFFRQPRASKCLTENGEGGI
jgi:hypothetical protein